MGANSDPHTSADAYTARTPAVSYRPMEWNDLDTVAACFDRVWPQGPALADPRGAATVTMFEDGFFVREGILEEDSDVTATTQAELELFMVNPDVRGAGVGGALWRQLLAALRSMGVRAFFLHTDSSCDFGFYDHKGLSRVAERLAADHPEDADLAPGMNTDDQFIYRADLASGALGGAFRGTQGEVCGA